MLLCLFVSEMGVIKRCTPRRRQVNTHTHTDIPACCGLCFLYLETTYTVQMFFYRWKQMSIITFHIDPSAQIAIWASRTKLFNAIYIVYYFPWVFGSHSGGGKESRHTLWVHVVRCCLLSIRAKETACEGTVSFFFLGPARWLWEQMHRVTQQVHTRVVHQNFSVIVFLVEGSLLTAEVLQEINCWRRSFMNWFCLFSHEGNPFFVFI